MAAPTGEELEALRAQAQTLYRELRVRKPELDDDSIDVIIRGARSHYAWKDKPVPEALLKTIYDITAAGATSMNCCPSRFIFVTSKEGKQRLAKSLKENFCFRMRIAESFLKAKTITFLIPPTEIRLCRARI